MSEGLYFFAGMIVTLAVIGTGVILRGPTEAQRRRDAARAQRPKTPPPAVGPRGPAGDSGAYRQQPVSRRFEPSIRMAPPKPPKHVKNSGIGNAAYRKGRR